jgi:hypothetical protein
VVFGCPLGAFTGVSMASQENRHTKTVVNEIIAVDARLKKFTEWLRAQ